MSASARSRPRSSPTFFATPAAFRKWLAARHAGAAELLVGFYKTSSGKPSVTWPESVDEALCFGWIDGVRRRVDETRYTIRFSPRKRTSVWSSINVARAQALIESGRMQAAGLRAFEARREHRSGIYSYEQRSVTLAPPYDALLRKNRAASAFFEAQPPSYRKAASWWVVSAKKDETRRRRLERLAAYAEKGERIPELRPTPKNRAAAPARRRGGRR